MLINKIKLNKDNLLGNDIIIPIKSNFSPETQQYEKIENNLDINGSNIINDIVDYEKIKLYPSGNTGMPNSLNFKLHFYNETPVATNMLDMNYILTHKLTFDYTNIDLANYIPGVNGDVFTGNTKIHSYASRNGNYIQNINGDTVITQIDSNVDNISKQTTYDYNLKDISFQHTNDGLIGYNPLAANSSHINITGNTNGYVTSELLNIDYNDTITLKPGSNQNIETLYVEAYKDEMYEYSDGAFALKCHIDYSTAGNWTPYGTDSTFLFNYIVVEIKSQTTNSTFISKVVAYDYNGDYDYQITNVVYNNNVIGLRMRMNFEIQFNMSEFTETPTLANIGDVYIVTVEPYMLKINAIGNGLVNNTIMYANDNVTINFINYNTSPTYTYSFTDITGDNGIPPVTVKLKNYKCTVTYKVDENYYIGWDTGSTNLIKIGFTEDDISHKRKNLTKSFIRLSFYDSKDLKRQNLLYYSIIYLNGDKIYSDYVNNKLSTDNLNCEILVEDPKLSIKNKSFEGFNIYLFKNDIPKYENKTIYMRVDFNNAANGKSYLFTKGVPSTINGYTMKQLYDNIYYEINCSYNNQLRKYVYNLIDKDIVEYVDNNDKNIRNTINIDLYQAKVI